MRPAQQRFETDHDIALDIPLRLIDEAQLVRSHGVAQFVLDPAAVACLRAHCGFEEAVTAAAFAFGTVKGGVCVAEQRLPVLGVVGKHGNADAAGDK